MFAHNAPLALRVVLSSCNNTVCIHTHFIIHQVQYLTSLSVELHIRTRSSLHPDPELDPVLAVFYYLHNDWPTPSGDENSQLGIIAIDIESCKCTPGASPLKDKKGKQVTANIKLTA